MQDIAIHIKQVRSEMRFYQGKAIPKYNARLASEVLVRLEVNTDIYQRRLKHSSVNGLQRQQVVRELTKLRADLTLFIKERHATAEKDGPPSAGKVPVVYAVTQLCDKLGAKPTHHSS